MKILVVDDDSSFRKTLGRILALEGFDVIDAGSGKAGIAKSVADRPDLILLDIVMPGLGGLHVCQELKQDPRTAGIPILILTGNDREGLEIACLDMGADDYLTKPVKGDRILAHCRALFRRSHPPERHETSNLSVGRLDLDYARKVVKVGGSDFTHLTPKEFDLLYNLASHSPQPRSRETLYKDVWGMPPPSDISLRTVEVHVRRIRLKLLWRSGEWLQTIPGRGYCLVPLGQRIGEG